MMKKIKLVGSFLALLGAVLISACSSDPVIDGGTGIPVADGFYITLAGVDPVSSSALLGEKVEADGFGTQDRVGFFSNYVFLAAGNYNVVSIIDQAISKTYGGTSAVVGTTGSDCELQSYTLVEEFAENGAAFNIAAAGLYKVIYDSETKEIIAYKIEKGQVIGAASPAGWSNSADQDMALVGAASATEVKFELGEVILRPGQYKVRFNCRWGIDRRIDPAASPGHEFNNGYVAFTNFGGTFDLLAPGGANFEIATAEDGKYKVTAQWTAADGFVLSSVKTTPLDPITFNSEAYQWSIVGDASPVGWPADNSCGAVGEDLDLNYSGYTAGTNTYTWTSNGAIALVAGGFKFRTNHCWDYNKGYDGFTRTGTGAADFTASGDGNFVAANSGSYIITITTSDDGETWTIDFVKQI